MAPAVSTTNSPAGSATQGGIHGSDVMGGSPDLTWFFSVAPPTVKLARCVAALPVCERNGTPKPNEVALESARGNGGAGGAAACWEGDGSPVCPSGVRDWGGGPSWGGAGRATAAAVDA